MIKPFLVLQIRPEDEASDNELEAFLKFGKLGEGDYRRVRIEKESIPEINLDDYSGVIVGGGPSNASAKDKYENQIRFEKELYDLFDKMVEKDFPYLGACYGHGIFSQYLGGEVSKEKYSEDAGAVPITITKDGKEDDLLKDLPETFKAFAGHKEACQNLAPGAVLLATSESCPIQMYRYKNNMYGCQFHPELDHEGLVVRINIYKHAGYFPPEDAEMLIAATRHENITIPETIFYRFIQKYSKPT